MSGQKKWIGLHEEYDRSMVTSCVNRDEVVIRPSPSACASGGGASASTSRTRRLSSIPITTAPLETKLAHHLRLAIHEGGSAEPRHNEKLKQAIKSAQEQGMHPDTIEQTIRQCADPETVMNRFMLQIRYCHKVCIVCLVHTINMRELQQELSPTLKQHNAAFAHVMNSFQSCGVLETIVSFQSNMQFEDFEGNLERDAIHSKASSIEIVDYETGAVNFKCESINIIDVGTSLKERGYKILHADYCFKPRKETWLTSGDMANYKKFLAKLREHPEIEEIFDNVHYPEEEPVESLKRQKKKK